MSDPRDQHDETIGDDEQPGAGDSGGTLADEGGEEPDTWNSVSENAPTIGSDDLPEDSLERMQAVWGAAVEPSVNQGMTIKVDEVVDEASVDEFEPSGKFSDAAPGDKAADELGGTVADDDEVATPDADVDGTVSDDVELPRVVSDAADRTLDLDGGEPAPGDGTLPDEDIEDTVASTPDATYVLDDDGEESPAANLDRTLADSPEAAAAAGDDNDATYVSDDDADDTGATLGDDGTARPADADRTLVVGDADEGPLGTLGDDGVAAAGGDETFDASADDADAPQHTLPDGAGARPSDDADRTFVMDGDVEVGADGTVVADGAGDMPDSGSFSDPQTMNLDRAADRTMVSDGEAGGGSGDPDTWDPHEQRRTHGSGGDHTGDDVGADVGVTVRPRSFRQSDDVVPTFAADYEVTRELGRGGMGVVFLARQTSIDRDVAVKMLKPPKAGKQRSAKKLAQQRTKFLAEAVVTGDLDHPNIVPVYDLGTDNTGAVFYSMKCVKGTPWDDVVADKSLTENLEIFMKACDAMAFAHNRGVIHRDLKPENIMLGDFGEVLVMDWGLALTTEEFTKAGKATKTGSIGGTPSYMAPEMASGDIKKVGTHSDVYLMGAILYEIVAGHPPHSGADVMKCLYNAAKNEIVPTDKTGELVDIAMKAMATRAEDRYESIPALQDAIREYQSHSESVVLSMRAAEDLVEARQSNEYEDFSKAMYGFQESYEMWPGNERARRGISEARLAYAQCAMGRGDLDLAGTLLVADDPAHAETRDAIRAAIVERDAKVRRFQTLKRISAAAAVLLFVVVTGAAIWINAARAEAVEQRGIAETEKAKAIEAQGIAETKTQEALEANEKLADQVVETEKQRDRADDQRMIAEMQKKVAEEEKEKAEIAEAKAVDEKEKAVIAQMKAEEEERKAKRAAFVSWANQQFANLAKVESDEARAAEAEQRRNAEQQRQNAIAQREIARAQELEALFSGYAADLQRESAEYATALAEVERLAADFAKLEEEKQREAAVAAQKAAEKSAEQERLAKLEEAKQREAAVAAQKAAEKSAEQERLAKLEEEKARKAQEYEAYVAQIGLAQAKIEENAFDSARELLVNCRPELRNWEWGRLMHLCSQSSVDLKTDGPVDGIALSPDGKLVAAATWSGKIVVTDLKTEKPVRTIVDGGLYVNDVAISPDGKLLASVGSDEGEYVKLWDLSTGKRIDLSFEGHDDTALSVEFSADGKKLLTSSYDQTARLWDVTTGRELKVLKGHSWWVWTARFDPSDENRVVTASQDGTAAIWDLSLPRPKIVATFTGHEGPVYSAAFSPDGSRAVSGGYDKRVLVWDPEKVRPFDFVALADGRKPEPPPFTTLAGHGGAVRTVGFSRDGALVVSGAHDNTIRAWDPATGDTVQVFRGHDGWVRSAEFSADGRTIVSGSKDQSVKAWSMADYEELRVLKGRTLIGHDDAILAARFSSDGEMVVTASRDRTARVYSVKGGETLAVLQEGHEFLATNAVFYPDRARMATSAADNSTRVWDVRAGTQLLEIDDTGRAAALDISPDGKWLVTGAPAGEDRTNWIAKLWDASTGELVRTFDGHRNEVVTVKFSPDGSTVLTGDARGTGRLFDTSSGKLLHQLQVHNRRINAAVFLDGGRRLLTASADNTVAQWDTETGKEFPERTLRNDSPVLAMDVVPGEDRVVTSSLDGRIRVWNVDGGEPVGTIGAETNGMVSGLDVSSDGKLVVTTHTDTNVVRVWRVDDGKEVTIAGESFIDWSDRRTPIWTARFAPENTSVLTVGGADARLWDLRTAEEQMTFSPHGAVAAADFSTNGRYVVTGSWDFSAKIWSVESGKAVARLDGGHTGFVYCARFSPDPMSRSVLTTSEDGTAKLWKVATHEVVQSFVGHRGPVVHGAFSADGKRVVTSSTDGTARVWDVETGKTLVELKGHEWGVLAAEFSRDGKFVVTGSEDNTARVWSLENGEAKEAFVLRGHTAAVTSISFSPDGTRVLTGSRDDTVKLWDATTGKEILTLDRHTEPVTAVAFSADGRYALTGSRDGTAIIWLAVDWQGGAVVAAVDRERREAVSKAP